MQVVRKGRVSSLGMAILVTTENAKDVEGTGLFSWNGNFGTVSSLGTAISEWVSSFGIVIGNRGKCEVDVCGTTASVLIFG
ncbi:20815_t:CDS:2, partial [Rhizophagus irregularis]